MNNLKTIDTLISARWVIPVEPHNVYHENYAVAIHQNRIIDLLPQDKAQEIYQAKETIDLSDHALLPGFINTHTHSPMTLFRGLADDLLLMDWLHNHIWPAEKAWLNEEFIHEGTQLAMAEMIRSGTTCFNEHYFHPQIIAEEATKAKMRVRAGCLLMELVTMHNSDLDGCLKNAVNLMQQYHDDDYIKVSLAPQGPYSVCDASLIRIREAAQEYQLPIHMHVHETQDEINQSITEFGVRPLKRLHQLGLLSPNFQAAHMVQLNEEDFDIIKETDLRIIHCPEANLKLASGFCPVDRLLKTGALLGLGTDGAASNNNVNLLGSIRITALLAKAVVHDATAVSAATALRMATLNGAKLLQWDHDIGSIEVGKSADIIAINLNELNTQPVYNPISQVVYAANATQVTHSWINGVCVMENRQLKTLDEEGILAKAKRWQKRIAP